jgi:hypothetical protein
MKGFQLSDVAEKTVSYIDAEVVKLSSTGGLTYGGGRIFSEFNGEMERESSYFHFALTVVVAVFSERMKDFSVLRDMPTRKIFHWHKSL